MGVVRYMNSQSKITGRQFQFLGRREITAKNRSSGFSSRRHRQRRLRSIHDPMLVLNMSLFNFAGGWDRTFQAIKVRETA